MRSVPNNFEPERLIGQKAAGLFVTTDPLFTNRPAQLVGLADRYALAADGFRLTLAEADELRCGDQQHASKRAARSVVGTTDASYG